MSLVKKIFSTLKEVHREDRELQKFNLNTIGNVAVDVIAEIRYLTTVLRTKVTGGDELLDVDVIKKVDNANRFLVDSESSIHDDQLNAPIAISPSGAIEVGELIRLVGGNFESTTPLVPSPVLPSLWDVNTTTSGDVSILEGELVISTGVTADATAAIQSVRRARFITATFNKSHQAVQIVDPLNTDVVRRWGMFDPSTPIFMGDGIFFENDSGNISVKRMKGGVIEETVPMANFNGANFKPENVLVVDGNVHIYELVYNAGSCFFYQDRKIIHKMTYTNAVGYQTVHLPVSAQIFNKNGNTVNNIMKTRGFSCSRVGSATARPDFVRVQNSGAGVAKTSAGTLLSILILKSGTGSANITVYDSPTAGVNELFNVDVAKALVSLPMGIDFSNGLSFTAANGSNFEVLIIFE